MAMLTNDEITAEALDLLECELGPAAHTTRKYEGLFGPQPGQSNKGATYRIRKPPLYEVNSSWTANYQSVDDDYVDLTIDKPRSIDVEITDEEMHLSMTNFNDQVLKPAMSRLAHQVNVDVMNLYKKTWHYAGVPETATSTTSDYLQVGVLMDNNCAPREDRAIFLPPRTMAAAVEAMKSLQNDQKKISEQFRKGLVAKDVLGFDWHMTQVVKNHLSGANTGAGLVDGAGQSGASLLADSFTAASAAFLEGDILDLTGYYEVNPVTKERIVGYSRRVVVTSDVVSDATGDETTIPIAPSLVLSGKTQNTTGTLADAEALLLFGHGSNYVSKTFPQGMAWPKPAIALAFCELKVPGGMDAGATKTDKELGISVRFTRRWDQDSSSWKARFQIFYGLAALRPEWMVRICG
jgi:hypothetical protein